MSAVNQDFAAFFQSVEYVDNIHYTRIEHHDHVRFFYLAVDLYRVIIYPDE